MLLGYDKEDLKWAIRWMFILGAVASTAIVIWFAILIAPAVFEYLVTPQVPSHSVTITIQGR